MSIRFEVILWEDKEFLCYWDGERYVDVSYPMITFSDEEQPFEIVKRNSPAVSLFKYKGKDVMLEPHLYINGWLALILIDNETGEPYTVLTVNLEDNQAFHLPDKAYIDVNNNPEAMEFLVSNKLAVDTGHRRQSGWVQYPMVSLNLPLIYKLNSAAFLKMINNENNV